MLRIPALLTTLALVGCAHTEAPKPDAAPEADAKASSSYYKGRVMIHLLDGRSFPGGESYVRRTVEPKKGVITEQVIQTPSKPGEKPREFVVTQKVDGAHFTMTERSNTFSGEGDLVGAPWAWTEWSSRSVLPDGNKVESHDVIAAGKLSTEKKVMDATGTLRLTMTEDFDPIDKGAFEKARTDILNPPAEVMPTTTPVSP